MSKIYRLTDRISVKINDIVVKVGPLSVHDKTQIQSLMLNGQLTKNLPMITEGIITAIQCAVKDISGLKDIQGNEYKLQFENNKLTKECVDELLNIGLTDEITLVCMNLLKGIPSQFTDNEGKPIQGVEIISEETNSPN